MEFHVVTQFWLDFMNQFEVQILAMILSQVTRCHGFKSRIQSAFVSSLPNSAYLLKIGILMGSSLSSVLILIPSFMLMSRVGIILSAAAHGGKYTSIGSKFHWFHADQHQFSRSFHQQQFCLSQKS
ncbi:hypothetical protein GBA52_006684 [Prunus armeniaca]|nr:hypothetical protein GBA52_006684 [Prunus armeniaca]